MAAEQLSKRWGDQLEQLEQLRQFAMEPSSSPFQPAQLHQIILQRHMLVSQHHKEFQQIEREIHQLFEQPYSVCEEMEPPLRNELHLLSCQLLEMLEEQEKLEGILKQPPLSRPIEQLFAKQLNKLKEHYHPEELPRWVELGKLLTNQHLLLVFHFVNI